MLQFNRFGFVAEEKQRQVRIEIRQAGLAYFLSAMHAGHSRRGSPELSSRLWGYYNEFSTWAFLFMALSGTYMWIATRPRLRWAQMSGSLVVFLILWRPRDDPPLFLERHRRLQGHQSLAGPGGTSHLGPFYVAPVKRRSRPSD